MLIDAEIATHIGLHRKENQDYALADEKIGLYVVADGLGGCPAGERASAEAVSRLQRILGSAEKKTLATLKKAFEQTSRYLFDLGCADPGIRGMGTTLSAMWIDGVHAHIAHVGDSRIYLLRDGIFKQVTTDHNLLQEMINRGDPDAHRYPHTKHLLVRVVGQQKVEVDVCTVILKEGDRFLLCSDGLHGVVPQEMLVDYLELGDPEGFVVVANGFGGPDNITGLTLTVG